MLESGAVPRAAAATPATLVPAPDSAGRRRRHERPAPRPHLAPCPDLASAAPTTPRAPPPRQRRKRQEAAAAAILVPLALLAVVSTVFGMMMAVASDLPALEQLPQVAKRKNSVLTDIRGTRLATLTSNQGRIIVPATRSRRTPSTPSSRSRTSASTRTPASTCAASARAFVQDVVQRRQAQGGSTIAQQFVKNALAGPAQRTVFEKLREAALAYHLTRKWSKERILTEYLNTVYFGNGAYGIEAAARTYFGADPNHDGLRHARQRHVRRSSSRPPRRRCWRRSSPRRARYDPVAHPRRRHGAGATSCSRRCSSRAASPSRSTTTRSSEPLLRRRSRPPHVEHPRGHRVLHDRGCASSLVDQLGAAAGVRGRPARSGRRSTSSSRGRAEQAVNNWLSWPGRARPPRSSRSTTRPARSARWSAARDYDKAPFNLATQGQRQPGSSFKPFILAEALRQGIGPGAVFAVAQALLPRAHKGSSEKFVVNNFEDNYAGSVDARQRADVLRQLGLRRSWASRSGPRRSPGWPSAWASARRSPRTSR